MSCVSDQTRRILCVETRARRREKVAHLTERSVVQDVAAVKDEGGLHHVFVDALHHNALAISAMHCLASRRTTQSCNTTMTLSEVECKVREGSAGKEGMATL